MFGFGKKAEMVEADAALPGRDMALPVPQKHFVLGTDMVAPWPANAQVVIVGMKKYAAAKPVIMKWCRWCLIRRRFHLKKSCKSFGKITTRHRACGRAMMSARNIARVFIVSTRHIKRPPKRAAICFKRN